MCCANGVLGWCVTLTSERRRLGHLVRRLMVEAGCALEKSDEADRAEQLGSRCNSCNAIIRPAYPLLCDKTQWTEDPRVAGELN